MKICNRCNKRYRGSQAKCSCGCPEYRPGWSPYKDGITQTLLGKFIVCRERFRLHAVEGLQRVPESFAEVHKMEFGSLLHAGFEEWFDSYDQKKAVKAIRLYAAELTGRFKSETKDVATWVRYAIRMFNLYARQWSRQDSAREFIATEQTFRVNYRLPSGREVVLRGKYDGIFKDRDKIWLLEHKVKGWIDEDSLQQSLGQNLQAMLYLSTLATEGEVGGILYDVVRRPLASKDRIRQTQRESRDEFEDRLFGLIESKPKDYFMRFRVPVTNADVASFERTTLDPLLEQLCDWFDWIEEHEPFESGNKLHYMRPFGIFDGMDFGSRGDYYDFITTGAQAGLKRVDNLFPELGETNEEKRGSSKKAAPKKAARGKAKRGTKLPRKSADGGQKSTAGKRRVRSSGSGKD